MAGVGSRKESLRSEQSETAPAWLLVGAGLILVGFVGGWLARARISLQEEAEPFLRALRGAPDDDEPETAEEAAAVAIARKELARGEGVPWDDVKRTLHTSP
jgi:hypothetical protein